MKLTILTLVLATVPIAPFVSAQPVLEATCTFSPSRGDDPGVVACAGASDKWSDLGQFQYSNDGRCGPRVPLGQGYYLQWNCGATTWGLVWSARHAAAVLGVCGADESEPCAIVDQDELFIEFGCKADPETSRWNECSVNARLLP